MFEKNAGQCKLGPRRSAVDHDGRRKRHEGHDCTTEGGQAEIEEMRVRPDFAIADGIGHSESHPVLDSAAAFCTPGRSSSAMTSNRDEHSIEDYDLDADGLDEHDRTESVTKVANVALFIMNLYLLYLMFSFIM